MNITYLEYSDHYVMGPNHVTAVAELNSFLMLCAAVVDAKNDEEQDDLFRDDDIEDELFESCTGTLYGFIGLFNDFFPDVTVKVKYKKICSSLASKGYWVDTWEEGTHALALDGFKKKAIAEMAKIEAEFFEDNF